VEPSDDPTEGSEEVSRVDGPGPEVKGPTGIHIPPDISESVSEEMEVALKRTAILISASVLFVLGLAMIASLPQTVEAFRPHGTANKILETPMLVWSLTFAFTFLGVGFWEKSRGGHLVAAAGWLVMGVFWIVQTRDYLYIENNPTNAIGSILSLPFFWFLAANEVLSFRNNEESRSLRFIAGMTLVAGVPYYLIEFSDTIAAGMIWFVAYQTWGVLALAGWDVALGGVVYEGGSEGIYVPIEGTHVSIILACTAIQALVIFIAAIYCTRAPRDRKIKAFLWSIPVIHILNIARNVGIIVLVAGFGWDFEFTHSYLGKGLSLLVLIFVSLKVFDTLPELHENIWGVVEQYKRWLRPGSAGADMVANDGPPS